MFPTFSACSIIAFLTASTLFVLPEDDPGRNQIDPKHRKLIVPRANRNICFSLLRHNPRVFEGSINSTSLFTAGPLLSRTAILSVKVEPDTGSQQDSSSSSDIFIY